MAGMDPAQASAESAKVIADLELVENNELASLGEREHNLEADTQQREAAREEREPGTYRTQQNAAVAHGVAATGMASVAHQNLVNRFAAQRTANQANLAQGRAGIKREREGVKLKKTIGTHKAESEKTEREAQYAAEHPPAPAAPQYPTPPAQQRAINEGVPPGPGGVVPYEGENVRVGKPPRKSYTPGGR